MTQKEFEEFVQTLLNPEDLRYAYECWDSLTDKEKETCNADDVIRDIQGTYEAIAEMED